MAKNLGISHLERIDGNASPLANGLASRLRTLRFCCGWTGGGSAMRAHVFAARIIDEIDRQMESLGRLCRSLNNLVSACALGGEALPCPIIESFIGSVLVEDNRGRLPRKNVVSKLSGEPG